MNGHELGETIQRFEIRNPNTNNEVNAPVAFNSMFKSNSDPAAATPVYLRSETAQGHFTSFRKLLDYNSATMPFVSAPIGKAFRNEISPRSGLLRAREFLWRRSSILWILSEKRHPKFAEVKDVRLPLLDREAQISGKSSALSMSVADTVAQRVIDTETLGYFVARTFIFLLKVGVDPARVRCRKHLASEMAHYATNRWDAETSVSYRWIECVGCADGSASDLSVHSKRTGRRLIVRER